MDYIWALFFFNPIKRLVWHTVYVFPQNWYVQIHGCITFQQKKNVTIPQTLFYYSIKNTALQFCEDPRQPTWESTSVKILISDNI
jgi:hypothetical protein